MSIEDLEPPRCNRRLYRFSSTPATRARLRSVRPRRGQGPVLQLVHARVLGERAGCREPQSRHSWIVSPPRVPTLGPLPVSCCRRVVELRKGQCAPGTPRRRTNLKTRIILRVENFSRADSGSGREQREAERSRQFDQLCGTGGRRTVPDGQEVLF